MLLSIFEVTKQFIAVELWINYNWRLEEFAVNLGDWIIPVPVFNCLQQLSN